MTTGPLGRTDIHYESALCALRPMAYQPCQTEGTITHKPSGEARRQTRIHTPPAAAAAFRFPFVLQFVPAGAVFTA